MASSARALDWLDSSLLFSEFPVGKKTAPNRFVAQPMELNNALEGGIPSDLTIKRYEDLARGNWGIIIIEAVSITPESLARKNQLVFNEQTFPHLQKIVKQIKAIDPNTIVLIQVTHSGVISSPAFSKCVSVIPKERLDYIRPLRNPDQIHVLTTDEIDAILNNFVQTVKTAETLGVDGIDYKSCHGYLGAEFLRPLNTRDDQYGGSFENRTRFFREGIKRIKEELTDPDFILGTRFSFYEGIPGGLGTGGPEEFIEDLSEPLQFVKLCNQLGLHYVNISAGIPSMNPPMTRPSPDFLAPMYMHFRYAAETKKLGLPIPVIGSAYSMCRKDLPAIAEKNLQDGKVDLIGVGRQNIADPEYPAHLKTKDFAKVRWCVGDNACATLLKNQMQVGCAVYDRYYTKLMRELRKSGKK